MVQNVEGGSAASVAELVEDHDVDVLVLADATDQQVAELVTTSLGRQLPHTRSMTGAGPWC